jgi:hypothetical protein
MESLGMNEDMRIVPNGPCVNVCTKIATRLEGNGEEISNKEATSMATMFDHLQASVP